jgi:hypothetical protein
MQATASVPGGVPGGVRRPIGSISLFLSRSAVLRALRPYSYHLLMVVVIPLAFFLDIHTSSIIQQDFLAVGAWLLLLISTRFSPAYERRQVWIMVGVATCVEIWGSIIWGVYRYRFGNLPLFVPPGHGLVYLFALRAARTPLLKKFPKPTVRLAIVGATAWAIFGLTLEPLVFHRLDLMGALWWPVFMYFMRKRQAPVLAVAFFITSFLELWGTSLGNWAWQTYAPVSHWPDGNPPSVIAAGYCLMDYTSLRLAAMLPPVGFAFRYLLRQPRLSDA